MRFADYPFLRYLLFLLLGIFLGRAIELPSSISLLGLLGVLWIAYLGINFWSKTPKLFTLSALAYLSMLVLGCMLIKIKAEKTHQENPLAIISAEAYLAEVTQHDLKKPNSFENLLEIKAVLKDQKWGDAEAKVIIYHQSQAELIPGQMVLVSSAPEQVAPPVNPYEFDYRAFLARKGILYRQFIPDDLLLIDTSYHSKSYALVHFRHRLGEMLKSKIPDEESEPIALALLLGQKKSLDPEVRDQYAQAGVMHILAVSGLHVGIVYALLIFLLKPLKLTKKQMRIYLLMVVGIIWFYAMLTGFSPSVVRASTMFSLLTFGQMRRRKLSIFNVLSFSAMLMIIANVDVIKEVGFQLSYLAVFGIVMIQPLIVRLWHPKTRVVEYIWQLAAVSIAAQLATFPLSIYYFNTFPTYFLLGNILILPLVFVIMQVGVPMLVFGWVPGLGDAVGWVVSKLILILNWITSMIQQIPGGKLDRLTIDFSGMLLVWGLLILAVAWQKVYKARLVRIGLSMLLFWAVFQLYRVTNKPDNQLVVYQGDRGVLFDFAHGSKLYSWNNGLKNGELSFAVDPNRLQNKWVLVPMEIKALSTDQGLDFHFYNTTYIEHENKLIFRKEQPKAIQYWSAGVWVDSPVTSSLKLGDAAYRILF